MLGEPKRRPERACIQPLRKNMGAQPEDSVAVNVLDDTSLDAACPYQLPPSQLFAMNGVGVRLPRHIAFECAPSGLLGTACP